MGSTLESLSHLLKSPGNPPRGQPRFRATILRDLKKVNDLVKASENIRGIVSSQP